AGRPERIGPSVWQGLYVALAGGALLAALGPAAPWIFALIGHAPELQPLEAGYFRILSYGAIFPLASSALSGFFSGRGKSWPVLWISLAGTAANIFFDYLMIF